MEIVEVDWDSPDYNVVRKILEGEAIPKTMKTKIMKYGLKGGDIEERLYKYVANKLTARDIIEVIKSYSDKVEYEWGSIKIRIPASNWVNHTGRDDIKTSILNRLLLKIDMQGIIGEHEISLLHVIENRVEELEEEMKDKLEKLGIDINISYEQKHIGRVYIKVRLYGSKYYNLKMIPVIKEILGNIDEITQKTDEVMREYFKSSKEEFIDWFFETLNDYLYKNYIPSLGIYALELLITSKLGTIDLSQETKMELERVFNKSKQKLQQEGY